MLNFYKKLSLVVLSGALTLGLSSVAVAKNDVIITNWLAAKKKLDCQTACKTIDMYVMMSGTDNKNRKPISICAAKAGGEWLVGYNRWKENTCTVGINRKEYRGKRYYCLCTTHMLQPLR